MNANLISWIITGIVALILLSSVLWGMKRGLKKSAFRFVWLLVTAIILFFVTPLVSNMVNNMDLSGLNLYIFGPVNKISDIGVNIVANVVCACSRLWTGSRPACEEKESNYYFQE